VLRQVADGVLVHESRFCQSNAVVVQGRDGVLLVDPGLYEAELAEIADGLRERGRAVVAGFSTHPHWDHLFWHTRFGDAPRYGTARCAAAAAAARERMADPEGKAGIAAMIPPDIAEQLSWDLMGRITALPAGTTTIPWDGPEIRIIEHQAHAQGHAALLIEDRGVLVAGDMLSDVLMPMLDTRNANPIEDYLAALELLAAVADGVDVVIPGHGSVGGAGQLRARIDQDRAYLRAVREGRNPIDPRIGPQAKPGWEWVGSVHEGQLERLAAR
jgi:glyoxylase-like metal-dependent hydrolase (beta-lactamase superfamily II)